jgi:peptide/nickel transport system substrate-binding protein
MEAPYQADKITFANSTLFTTDWVGLGPYRLTNWVQGSHMEMTRFDDYFGGKAPFDRVNFHFYFDGNAMAATVLAGALDVVEPPGIDLDAAVDIQQRWAGTGNRVRIEAIPRLADVEIQFRPELAKPTNGLRDLTVRKAFYQAINRQELSDVMAHGLAPIADSWIQPTDPIRPQVESAIPQYPFDPTAAQRLLAQAGWTRGPDGILVHQPDGERFESTLVTIPQYGIKPAQVLAAQWKAIGADISVFAIPPASSTDRSQQSTEPFGLVTGSFAYDMPNRMDGRLISTAANRWSGRNQSGWQSPAYDVNLDKLASTLDPQARTALLREQQSILMGAVARFELYWEVYPVAVRANITGDIYPYRTAFNMMEWSKTD